MIAWILIFFYLYWTLRCIVQRYVDVYSTPTLPNNISRFITFMILVTIDLIPIILFVLLLIEVKLGNTLYPFFLDLIK